MMEKSNIAIIGMVLLFLFMSGFQLVIGISTNIFSPPQQTSPPLWAIIVGAVILIMLFKKS